MIETDLSHVVPSIGIRKGVLCIALVLGGCVEDADLGDVPSETGSTGVESVGGCERVAGEPADPHSWALICGSDALEILEVLEVAPSGDVVLGMSTLPRGDAIPQVWQLGEAEYTHSGQSDGLLMRFDAAGELLWSRYFASEGHVAFGALATCGEGHVIAVSARAGVVESGDDTFEAEDFIARLDADGELLWSRPLEAMGPNAHVTVADAKCDANGNVAISGTARDGVDFGQGLLPAGTYDAFVAKFDSDGEPLFGKTLLADPTGDSGADAWARAVETHDDGSTYVLVDHDAALDFGSGPVGGGGDDVRATLARLSEDGDLLWSAQIRGDIAVYAGDLAVDEQGRAVVAGQFLGLVELGGVTFENVFPYDEQQPATDGTNYDVYIAAFELDGTFAWGEAAGWMGNEQASLARFAGGEAMFYRVGGDQISLAAQSADDSTEVLGVQFDAANTGEAYQFARGNDDTIVLGGTTMGSYDWPLDLSSSLPGSLDVVLLHFDL